MKVQREAHVSVAEAWKISSCINVRHLFRPPWHMQTHLGQSSLSRQWHHPPMTAKPVWQTSMPALVKKQSNFFLTVFVCANAMETPCLHGDTSDPGTGGLFFFPLWRGTDREIEGAVTSLPVSAHSRSDESLDSRVALELTCQLSCWQLIDKVLTNKEQQIFRRHDMSC